MLEIISNLRNNNLRKIPGYDPSRIEHLRKVLRPVIRESGKVFEMSQSILIDSSLHCTPDIFVGPKITDWSIFT